MIWLLQNALLASAGALCLMAALRRWRPAPRIEHLLWVVLAVKFVLPPLAVLPLPVVSDVPAPLLRAAPLLRTAPAPSVGGGQAVSDVSAASAPGGTMAPMRTEGMAGSARRWWDTLPLALGLVWLGGAGVVLLLHASRHHRWLRARRRGRAPPALVALAAEVAARMDVRAPLVELDRAIEAPLVTGWLRPRLLWPAHLATGLDADRTRTVLAHEMAHLRRGDLWIGLLEVAVGATWWWYPGWRLVRRGLRDSAERACDAAVVAAYPALRRAYAEGLLEVADAAARRPALALGLEGPGPVHRRLRAILGGDGGAGGRRGLVAAVLAAVLLLPAWQAAAPAAPDTRRQDAIVAALARAAADPAPAVRRVAANALRDIGGMAAERVLGTMVEDPDPDVRRAVRVALGLEAARPNKVFPETSDRRSPANRQELDTVMSTLATGTADARLRAAWRLGNLRDPRSVPALVAALGDADFHVRQAAADALGNVGERDAAPALLATLADDHPRVRQSAASSLGNLGAAGAARHLVRLLSDPDAHVRQAAATAIGHTGGSEQVPALAAALNDPDEHVRRGATSALGRIARGRQP